MQVSAVGGVPSTVDLLVDGTAVATIASPFQYTLATSSLSVGSHALVALGHFGGTTAQSAPVSIVVDRTAPTIALRTPAIGASNVHVADPIVVQFSEPVLASSLSGSAVTLTYNGAAIGYASSLSADGASLTVTPSQPTDGGGSFALSLTSAITDLAGNALSSGPLSWSWTSPQWLTYAAPALPVYASTTAFSASNPLSLNPNWTMGSPTTFEFDATAYVGSTQLPSVLMTNMGSGWSSVAPPTWPTAPVGFQAGPYGYTFGASGLGAYWYYTPTSTNTTAVARFIEEVSTYSAGAWSSFTVPTAYEDPTYGYFVTDAAGNAYHAYCPTNATTCTFYKRVNGTWSVETTLTVPASTRTALLYLAPGSYLALNYPWSASQTTAVSGNLTLSRFDGTAWTTVVNAPNPVNATARSYYQFFLDPSNNPYVGFSPCATNTGAACSVYLMTPNGNAWQLFGGGPLPTQIYDWDAGSVPGAFAFDRFGRLSAYLDGYMGAAGTVQETLLDWRNGAWTATNVPVPTAAASASDIGFNAYMSGSDFAGNPAWVETHATADATGLNATATATFHLLNR